ncbi:hypothetical protein C8F01DRAFT_1095517 [Mycena amicta]|nr:hypothetical protein C8F01DRAFT_1095517 [Mycena amicta]
MKVRQDKQDSESSSGVGGNISVQKQRSAVSRTDESDEPDEPPMKKVRQDKPDSESSPGVGGNISSGIQDSDPAPRHDRPPFLTFYRDEHGYAMLMTTQFPAHSTRNLDPPHSPAPFLHRGWRRSNANGVDMRDVLLPGPLPPHLLAKDPIHACEICRGVKSHPVLCACGHTFCYLCIRISLQTSWKCPTCDVIIRAPPVRNLDVEDMLEAVYPKLATDQSRVSYTWSGLIFPTIPSLSIRV